MFTTVNETELRTILETTPADQNIMIAGKHGIGKSVIIKKFFEAKGKKVVTMFCSQAADPGDIIGLPRYNEDSGKTEFALPWWFPTDNTPVVLFLDELNRARPEILQVVMDLTLNRKLAGKELPAGSQVISAINEGDEYQLTDLDPALVSRFNLYNFVPTPQDWIRWATRNGIDSRVISFITTNVKYLDSNFKEDNSTLDKTPDRRAWERVSDIMKLNPTFDLSFKKMISGIVGAAAAVSFYDSLQKNSLVTPKELLTSFSTCADRLKEYSLQQLSYLNDNVCSYIDSSLGDFDDPVKQNQYAENLNKYFTFLADKKVGNREAFAHFINNYETMAFPNLNMLVASNPDTLEDVINNFIISTKTR
jgi:MoxR-like ATPase